MMVAGTSSKCVGKGSSPNLRASSQAQSIASRSRSISLSAIQQAPSRVEIKSFQFHHSLIHRNSLCFCDINFQCGDAPHISFTERPSPHGTRFYRPSQSADGEGVTLGEELPQSGIHFLFIRDSHGDELFVGDLVVSTHERTG